jgi:cell division protein FtsN
MKQDVSPGLVAVVVVILVAIIGFAAFKTFGHHAPPPSNGQTQGVTSSGSSGAKMTPQDQPYLKMGSGQPSSGGK